MVFARIKAWLAWSWTYLWLLWAFLVLILVYILRVPLKLSDSLENSVINSATSYFNNLTPKFYVALTGTSSLVSGIILIFEWWYFKNNGVETVSEDGSDNDESIESSKPLTEVPESKVWRNPVALFRGAEYSRAKDAMDLEPLTFYDMNLSAQDHQSFFTCDEDSSRPDYDIMSVAWRERETASRVNAAREALRINPECAPALVLLAEEDCSTIAETEATLKRALKATEANLSANHGAGQLVEKFSTDVFQRQCARRRDLNMLMYVKRRLAMCARKQGRIRDAIKIFKDIIREGSISNVLGVQENLIEACLEMQGYADVQGLLVRYDGFDIREPRSAVMSYTSALLKARVVADKFVDASHRRALSSAETTAIEAIMRAIEFNPHVPLYLLEIKPMILPPEHYLKRGDSEAISYAFYHIQHWKRIDGALQLLASTWKGEFVDHVSRFHLSGYCYPYSPQIEGADRELLPSWHQLSVFPKKESAWLSLFQSFLCLIVCVIAIVAHVFPEQTQDGFSAITYGIGKWLAQIFDTVCHWFPENAVGLLSAKPLPNGKEQN